MLSETPWWGELSKRMRNTMHKVQSALFISNGVTFENRTTFSIDRERVAKLVDFLRANLEVAPELGVDVTFVNEEEMSRLHVDHMGEEGPTDVLSFPMDSGIEGEAKVSPLAESVQSMLGDIVICPAFALSQMQSALRDLGDAPDDLETEFAAHVDMLIAHSMLHLIGHDHPDEASRVAMFAIQEKLLASWSIS